MSEQLDWVPDGVDVDVPNAARMYDYALGGYHNFAVDREHVARMERLSPGAAAIGWANREFVGRAVRWLVSQGIRQFLDLGSGIPTLGNVHQIAQAVAPDARVMYVDIDPVAVAHSNAILAGNPLAMALQGDLRQPGTILDHPEVTDLLDFGRPLAVLCNAVLHFVTDADDPVHIMAEIRDRLVADSYVGLSHANAAAVEPTEGAEVGKVYDRTPTPLRLRDKAEVAAMLVGLELVEPGIVPVTEWRPELSDSDDPVDLPAPILLAAVARRP
jgi:hypothetical protein